MLKTLEEPPEHVKVHPRHDRSAEDSGDGASRCLQFNLKQMPPAAIAGHLAKVLAAEKIEYEPEALPVIARAAAAACATRCRCSTRRSRTAAAGRRAGVSEMLGTIDQSYLCA
jgi:DNA polymerase-3 subunit gamma/tau